VSEPQRWRAAWQLAEGDFLLVRPDLFVDCRGRLDDTGALAALLERVYGCATPQPAAQLAG
jgi:hypothetical protein